MLIKLNKEARKALREGIEVVANAVKTTMGAEGKTVIIRNKMGFRNHITKDGVTVAESIMQDDAFREMGGQLLKEAVRKTVDLVGDSTTTTSVLTQQLVTNAVETLELLPDTSHVEYVEGMNIAFKEVQKNLHKLTKKVGKKEMFQIATVSANNDPIIGRVVSDTFERVGNEGTIDIQEGVSRETTTEFIDGMSIERGWAIPHFITDQSTMTVTLENSRILIYDGPIKSINDIAAVVRECQTNGQSLFIIAEDVDEGVMATLAKSKMQGTINVSVTLSPDFGLNRTNILEDLAAFTSGEVFSTKTSSTVKMGFAKKILSDKNRTVFICEGVSEEVEKRVESLKVQLENTVDQFDKVKLSKRLSNLKNTVAIIYVGGVTESEVKEKKDRIEDSVHAVRSSLDGGFVSGGGSTLRHISEFRMKEVSKLSGATLLGYDNVRVALYAPFRQILENASMKEVNYNSATSKFGYGVNVKTRKVENLLKTGIIDSTKALEVALENAVSVASLVIKTDCLISDNGL
jgi:chaperonin GroEL